MLATNQTDQNTVVTYERKKYLHDQNHLMENVKIKLQHLTFPSTNMDFHYDSV